jgi:hypothetical protein
MQTTPIQPLIDKWYNRRRRGPWFYPASPYGLGDLVPGNMPTRFGPLMPIPDAAAILAAHGVSPAPAEYFAKSIGQETGREYDSRPVVRQPLPANLNQRPDAGLPVGARTFMRPMPSVFYPRPDASTIPVEGSFGCWVQEHPVLAAGAAGLLYFVLKGGKKR